MQKIIVLALLFLLSGCMRSSSYYHAQKREITSITFVDKNGLSETIAEKERLLSLQNIDFLSDQPYQKVLRVYTRGGDGKIPSLLTSYYDNGQIHQYLEIVNGRAHGSYIEWYPTGQKH